MTITIEENELNYAGTNLKAVQKDNLLILVVDLSAPTTLSSTGKMKLIAKTDGGFAALPINPVEGKPVKLNLNLGISTK